MTIRQLHDIVGGRLRMASLAPAAGEATGVGYLRTDIHAVSREDVYWALPGDTQDAAELAQDAYRRGASGVVFQQKYIQPWPGSWSLELPDTHSALVRLLRACRKRFHGSVIAIDAGEPRGIAAELVHRVLSTCRNGLLVVPDEADPSGLPLELLHLDDEQAFAVVERGAQTLPGAIDFYEPQVAVAIGVAPQAASLKSMQSEPGIDMHLLASLDSSGWAVLNADDERLRHMGDACAAQVVWVGRSAGADVRAENVHRQGNRIVFSVNGFPFRISLAGANNLAAALAAIAVGRIFGYSMADIARGLDDSLPPGPQRRLSAAATQPRKTTSASHSFASSSHALSRGSDGYPHILSFTVSRDAAIQRIRDSLQFERDAIRRFKAA